MASDPQPKAPKKPLPLWAALASAVGLILLPVFVMGPLHVPFIVLWVLGAIAFSFRAKLAPIRNQRLRNLLIYLSASILAVAMHGYRIGAAQTSAKALISAIKAYRAEHKAYPPNLDALVPKHIDHVPTGAFGRFYYHVSKDKADPFFFYVTLPPFGRRGYCFEDSGNCAANMGGIPLKDGWYDFD